MSYLMSVNNLRLLQNCTTSSQRVTVPIPCQAAPYTMLRETSEQMTGNDRYEGFCVDLIHEISEILGFNYTIKIADDAQHGKFDKKLGRWNGMIGELLDQVRRRTRVGGREGQRRN
uniref:Ionotropic glutamate receptor L-glutamate and glycine-binding domain-containing protein n=1 Tax=Scylla olivacea TaxID=85551 RepID=A0A0P4WGS7_SCYOL